MPELTRISENGTIPNGCHCGATKKHNSSDMSETHSKAKEQNNAKSQDPNENTETPASTSRSRLSSISEDFHEIPKQSYQFEEVVHDPDVCEEYIIKKGTSSVLVWMLLLISSVGFGFYFNIFPKDRRLQIVIFLGFITFIAWVLNQKVIEESLLVTSCLGVQITTKYASGRQVSIFYDRQEIKDIIIQESISMQQVIYVMSVLLKTSSSNRPQLIPLFTNSFPRLVYLQQIYDGVQSVMAFNEQKHEDS